jgi:hypothetical protein
MMRFKTALPNSFVIKPFDLAAISRVKIAMREQTVAAQPCGLPERIETISTPPFNKRA